MTNVVQFALLGIGAGAIYALLGQGIVLIYRGSGVLNIAHGGFAMLGGFVYVRLHAPNNFGALSSGNAKGWPILPAMAAAVPSRPRWACSPTRSCCGGWGRPRRSRG